MDANEFKNKPKYINGKNIEEFENRELTIIGTASEIIKEGEPKKLCVCFDSLEIQLVLNQTNLITLINEFGSNTDSWRFKTVMLISVPGRFNGQPVKSVIIKVV